MGYRLLNFHVIVINMVTVLVVRTCWSRADMFVVWFLGGITIAGNCTGTALRYGSFLTSLNSFVRLRVLSRTFCCNCTIRFGLWASAIRWREVWRRSPQRWLQSFRNWWWNCCFVDRSPVFPGAKFGDLPIHAIFWSVELCCESGISLVTTRPLQIFTASLATDKMYVLKFRNQHKPFTKKLTLPLKSRKRIVYNFAEFQCGANGANFITVSVRDILKLAIPCSWRPAQSHLGWKPANANRQTVRRVLNAMSHDGKECHRNKSLQ